MAANGPMRVPVASETRRFSVIRAAAAGKSPHHVTISAGAIQLARDVGALDQLPIGLQSHGAGRRLLVSVGSRYPGSA
jgi:hypothetical protein